MSKFKTATILPAGADLVSATLALTRAFLEGEGKLKTAGPAIAGVSTAFDSVKAKVSAVKADPKLTPEGKREALTLTFREAHGVLQPHRDLAKRLRKEADTLRARALAETTPAVDATDEALVMAALQKMDPAFVMAKFREATGDLSKPNAPAIIAAAKRAHRLGIGLVSEHEYEQGMERLASGSALAPALVEAESEAQVVEQFIATAESTVRGMARAEGVEAAWVDGAAK